MKNIARFGILSIALLAASPAGAIVGYYNYLFSSGDTLFQNGLSNANNHISALFPGREGVTISLWDPASQAYGPSAVLDPVLGWIDPETFVPQDFELLPGTGAKLNNPGLAFTGTFVGEVLNHDGSFLAGQDPMAYPPPYSGPAGLFLRGDKMPLASGGVDIFMNIFGRGPNQLEQIIKLQDTYTYLGDSLWNHNGIDYQAPSMAVGEAALFNIGPVPEPSAAALGLLGLALAGRRLWRKA